MDKVNQRTEREKERKLTEPSEAGDQKKFVELADKNSSGSRDNCILSEFMQLRDAKFSRATANDNEVINDNINARQADEGVINGSSSSRWSGNNSRLSKSSSAYSVRSVNTINSGNNTGGWTRVMDHYCFWQIIVAKCHQGRENIQYSAGKNGDHHQSLF